MSRRVLASDSHRTVDLSAQLAAEMLKRRGQGRNIWRPTLGFVDQGGDEAVPDAPDANTICHGWMLEFDGAYWAKASASFTSSRGTGWGKNSRVESRSLIA